MPRLSVCSLAVAIVLLAAPAFAEGDGIVAPGPDCAHIFTETGVPTLDADNGDDVTGGAAPHTFVCRKGYALYHNNATHIPDWVAEDVTSDEIEGNASRKDNFQPDPLTPPPAGSSLANYAASGFDRGHQAPAADFKSDQQLTDESFYLSNMAPQIGKCFNRGIWAQLEDEVRGWAGTRERLIVFTGPVYPDPVRTIGDEVAKKPGDPVAVPEAFYKIVYHPKTGHAVAFLLPNKKLCSEDPNKFVTSIGKIREQTGIDFFTGLSARAKRILERTVGNNWGW
jgi:endonuclease G